MVKKLILFFVVVLMMSCSMTTKLSKKYVGRGVEVLYREMGNPQAESVMENGDKLLVYEKETYIKQTEIGTGRGTLDPKISPSFSKVETYWFEVNKEGIIVQTNYRKKIDK
jgi:hypothetical protein